DPCGGGSIISGGTGSSCCGADGGDMGSFSASGQPFTGGQPAAANGQSFNLPAPAPAASGSTPGNSGNATFGIDSSIKTPTPAFPFGQKPAAPQQNPASGNPAPGQGPAPAANPAKTPSPLPGTSGVLQMNVPENSVVYINGYRTKLTGTERNFTAKNLIPGESYEFEIKVVSVEDGQLREQVKTTSLTPGNTAVLAFDFSEQRSVHTIALK
ncbi:MAG: TIGR03000 domain-containing protein, partial [Planctomycetia bacterium]|nr:TIGR03000 domain-containing protein [Planctomycetia bacterium]